MLENDIRNLIATTLNLGARADGMTAATPLLGALPELDSMAVVGLITQLEERFDITVMDDEISAETFETLGSLTRFVEEKTRAG
jgi:acyl carrier protein